jgi:hypothetical protein
MSSAPLAFVADPKADIALVSSDGQVFPVQRAMFQVLSGVFADMFKNPGTRPGETDKATGLPAIKLDETGNELRVLLRLLVKGQTGSGLSELSLTNATRSV